uniref:Uncharacterized protein n=1 Tax=Anguilla anguilla TaxID=7936 RepID=A0A0E9T1X0_ANGAN
MKLVFLGCFGIKRNLPFTFEVYVVDEIHYCLEIHVLNQLCYFSLVFSSTYLLICSLACSVLLKSVLKPSDR